MQSQLLSRLVLEQLASAMTSERARQLFRAALGPKPSFEVEALLDVTDGPLRTALIDELGPADGDLLADRICDVLSRHATSGIRTKAEVRGEAGITVAVVSGPDPTCTEALVAGIESMGLRAVVLRPHEVVEGLENVVAAFLVPSDLPIAEVRELAWRVGELEDPATVIVWPVEPSSPTWGKALGHPIHLERASFSLLAETLLDRIDATAIRKSQPAGG